MADLSILKNQKAGAIRFWALAVPCRELDCQPGDILEYRGGEAARPRKHIETK
jgi:putative transcriptional regulator